MVLKERVSIDELIGNGKKYHPDRVKFCIDRKREIVAIDEEMHIDMEYELLDDGSSPDDIFGGDIVYDKKTGSKELIWEAHPNIERNRLMGIGQGRALVDLKIIDELKAILIRWVY